MLTAARAMMSHLSHLTLIQATTPIDEEDEVVDQSVVMASRICNAYREEFQGTEAQASSRRHLQGAQIRNSECAYVHLTHL